MSKQLTLENYALELNRQLPFLVPSTVAAYLADCSKSTLSKAKHKGEPYSGENRGVKVIAQYVKTEKGVDLWQMSWE